MYHAKTSLKPILRYDYIISYIYPKCNSSAVAILKKTWYFVLIMAVCLYGNSFFKTEAANYLSAAKLYTLSQGGTMAIGTLMSAFIFKEKLTLKSYVSIAITFIGLLIINL